ncbi:MAG: SDR family oxidoreductase [Candidatus Methanodesulfokora sp.]|jgi:3-oxoacyl-[acyl-carrier protein] reductase|nr:MAG: NAD(P)-dependent oxidoreductase [Candidatus Korarchaeota archaeon]
MEIAGSVALVTGAGRGIGRAVSLELAKKGASLLLFSRTEGPLLETTEEIRRIGGKVIAISGDVSSREDARKAVRLALDSFGRLDILVNNAGVGYKASITELSIDEIEEQIKVNYMGSVLFIKEALPHMLKQGRGCIVNMISTLARSYSPGWSAYSASKAALMAFTETIREELASTGVRVIGVYPSLVSTDMMRKLAAGKGRALDPSDVAKVIVIAIEQSDKTLLSDIVIAVP